MSAQEPGEAFATFEGKWLAAHPEQAMAGLFVAPGLRLRAVAFGALVHELHSAAYRIREPQVAAAKLVWWSEELERSAHGQARHPVTQALFDENVCAADPHLWPALAIAALNQIEAASAATFEELLAQREPFALAIADAESALFLGGAANIDANAALWTLSTLLHALPDVANSEARLPVPLDLLARHGLSRASLAAASGARSALVRDQLASLRAEMQGALGVASARTLALRVRLRVDRWLIEQASRAPDPLDCVASRSAPGRLRSLYFAWSEARAALRGR